MSILVDFHRGTGRDAAGRSLDEIRAWPDRRLEATHDYIQWLFPLAAASAFNPSAPLADAETRAAFAAEPALRRSLRASLDRMLLFYGYERGHDDGKGSRIEEGPHFGARAVIWLTPGNHNFLRLTRILTSLVLLGLPGEAAALLRALEETASRHAATIGNTTLRFWRQAVPAEAVSSESE